MRSKTEVEAERWSVVVVVVGLSMFLDAALRMLVVEDGDGVARKGCCYHWSLKTKALRMMKSCSGELECVESITARRKSDEICVWLEIGWRFRETSTSLVSYHLVDNARHRHRTVASPVS